MSHLVLTLVLAVSTTSYAQHINLSSPSWGGRIVGGENTTIEEHPYQVSLEISGKHSCGGSLIKPNVILTAAHCVQNSSVLYSVRAGSTIMEEGGHVVNVSDVCNHPKYHGPYDLDYDVSVLKLDQAFDLNSAIQLISLQNPDEEIPVGTAATVTGWGTLEWKGRVSKYLQKVEIPKLDEITCQKQLDAIITDRMTCYGYSEGKKDACEIDSGGPLVVNRKQVGIVSFGDRYGCARPNKPGVYTRIANKEIRNHINNCLAKFDKN